MKKEKAPRFTGHRHTWLKVTKDLMWRKGDMKPPYFLCNVCGKMREEQPKSYKEPSKVCNHSGQIMQLDSKKGETTHICRPCGVPVKMSVTVVQKLLAPATPSEVKRFPRTKENQLRAQARLVKRARKLFKRGKLTRKRLKKLYRAWLGAMGLERSLKRLKKFKRRVHA